MKNKESKQVKTSIMLKIYRLMPLLLLFMIGLIKTLVVIQKRAKFSQM